MGMKTRYPRYGKKLGLVARAKTGGVLAAPSKSLYGGTKQKTYAEYCYYETARVQLDAAFATEDYIQNAAWLAQPFYTMCGNDSELYALAQAHEFVKVRYTGVQIRPEFNSVAMQQAVQCGEIGLVPIVKDSAFKFATFATGGSPVYNPPDMTTLCNGVAGTRIPSGSVIGGRWKSLYQPGLSIGDQYLSPEWADVTPSSWNVPEKADWSPLWNTSGASAGQELTPLKVWTPAVVFANWNTSEEFPAVFTLRFVVKLAFKDKRLKTGGAAFSGAGAPSQGLCLGRLRRLGAPAVPEEDWKEEEPREEKKYPEPQASPPVHPGPPKAARTESNSGLVRQLTNIGLGGTRIPQPPPGTGVKRVNDVAMG